MIRPLVTLTTDFGDESYYVGALRGALLSRCPEAMLVDITHHLPPYAPAAGAFVLAQACPRFPPGTIHLAVVDPGVGTPRRPLLVGSGGHWFVGPDNGLLTPFLHAPATVLRLREEDGALSATFHGRDLFAPAAGRLASGEDPRAMGVPLADPLRLRLPVPERRGAEWIGEVILVDRFGNLVTSFHADHVNALGDPATVTIAVGAVRFRGIARTYHDALPGAALALVGSSGHLEVAVVEGDAARTLGVGRGDPVVLSAS